MQNELAALNGMTIGRAALPPVIQSDQRQFSQTRIFYPLSKYALVNVIYHKLGTKNGNVFDEEIRNFIIYASLISP